MKYFGIADAHGIESFIKGEPTDAENSQKAMMLHFRAGANRHRHAVVFVVDISEDDAESIEADLADGLYIEALDNLKGSLKELQLTKLPGAEKSWGLIPNPDLDPYH
jgi:hypothetical protein